MESISRITFQVTKKKKRKEKRIKLLNPKFQARSCLPLEPIIWHLHWLMYREAHQPTTQMTQTIFSEA